MQDCFVSRVVETDLMFLEKNISIKCLHTDDGGQVIRKADTCGFSQDELKKNHFHFSSLDKTNLYKVNYWYTCSLPKYALYMLFLVDIGPDFFLNVTLYFYYHVEFSYWGRKWSFFQQPTEAVSKVWFWRTSKDCDYILQLTMFTSILDE